MSPYPTVVMVTTAHQNASGIDLKKLFSLPASAKYTADENSTTPLSIYEGAYSGNTTTGDGQEQARDGSRYVNYLMSP